LKEKLSPETRELLETMVKEAVLEVLRDLKQPTHSVRSPNLSPETMILTEKDFRFLQGLKISSKGMLLGENSRG
jgi:hypothetical protein